MSFGTPLSLRAHVAEQGRDPEMLAGRLMDTIGDVVPILPVPLLALVLQDGIPRSRDEIAEAVTARLASFGLPPDHAVHCAPDEVLETGLAVLLRRALIVRDPDGRYSADPSHGALLQFYANSISHLMARNSASA